MAPAHHTSALDRLMSMQGGVSNAEALELFDSLPSLPMEESYGRWVGFGVPTNNPLDGVLERTGWHGKRFLDADRVDPLVMRGMGGGFFALNPAKVPLAAVLRGGFLARPGVQRALRPFTPLFRTSRPAARLRTIEYRGVVSTAMSYDALPVIDHFRVVDERTIMGAMDMRGLDEPFMFALQREL